MHESKTIQSCAMGVKAMVNRINPDLDMFWENPNATPVKRFIPEPVNNKPKPKRKKRSKKKDMEFARSFRGRPIKRLLYRLLKWLTK